MPRRTVISLCALAVLAIAIGTASAYVLWLGDDIDYGAVIHTSIWDSHGSLLSWPAFWASQFNHYWYVNGRFVAHTLVAFFCGVAGQPLFALCNGAVYALFVWLLLRLGGFHNPLSRPRWVVAVAALVILIFVTKMMPTTQIGYEWMFALNLWWLLLFVKARRYQKWWQQTLLVLLSMVAGNGQEALTLGLGAGLGLWWLRRRCRVGGVRTAMLCGYWAGVLALCLSPGTLGRTDTTVVSFADTLTYTALSLWGVYVLVAVMIWCRVSPRQLYFRNPMLCNAAVILLIFNLLVGVFSNRQLMGIELLALVMAVRTAQARRLPIAVVAVLAVLAAAFMGVQAVMAYRVRRQFADIEAAYLTAPRGIVNYDRTLATTCPWLREYRHYEDIIDFGRNDTHHSLQKLLYWRHHDLRPIKVWPRYLAAPYRVTDTVICYAPGHFAVLVRDASPRRPMVVRRSMLTGRRDTDSLVINRWNVRGRGWGMAAVTPDRPFTVNDTVFLSDYGKNR